MSREINYTDNQLLELLRNFYLKNGKVTCTNIKQDKDIPCYQYYVKRFGSWESTKEKAGIPKFNRKEKRITKEMLMDKFKTIVKEINRIPRFAELNNNNFDNFPSSVLIYNYFKTYDEFIEACGFQSNSEHNGKFKNEFLINEIKRFVEEFGRVPIMKDFENLKGYPARKTFTNHFESLNEVIRLAGFEPVGLNKKENYEEKYNKKYLLNLIYTYKDKYNKVPTSKDLHKELGVDYKSYYKKVFGSWNNALKEANLPLNSVSQYDDEFLHSEFDRFVKEHNGRVPTYAEFNNSEYPSFWCYQNRFGSWNKAVESYGYEPNDINRKYKLDNGEICASSYEYDISSWLQEHNVKYDRNIPYVDIDTEGYKGKMDCDYKIYANDKIWYVEMAGFLSTKDFNKLSKAEQIYYFKLKYKKKMLKRSEVNYLIIYPSHLKKKSMEDIFSFIN